MITRITKAIVPKRFYTDTSAMLRVISRSAWVMAGVLFVGYGYFVGAMTFSVITQQQLEQSIKGLISDMSREELSYLAAQKDLGLDTAEQMGLSLADASSYTTIKRAFAWNVEQ